MNIEERLSGRINYLSSNSCWVWIGSINNAGYGQIYGNGRMMPAHRYLYEYLVGMIPQGLQLDHLCRNRKCVNPMHLEPVTPSQNVRRGSGPQAINARKTHCKNGHLLEPKTLNKYGLLKGKRQCKICINERYRIWRANRRKMGVASDNITRL